MPTIERINQLYENLRAIAQKMTHPSLVYRPQDLCQAYLDIGAEVSSCYTRFFPYECSIAVSLIEEVGVRGNLSTLQIELMGYVLEYIQKNHQQKVKPPKLFISHSEQDQNIVEPFVNLLASSGIGPQHIFCSSVPGYGIRQGSGDIYDYLRHELANENLYVLFMLSDHYYKSAPCLNEMGAAWTLQAKYQSILLPGFQFGDMKGTVNPRDISFRLDDRKNRGHALTEIKDNLFQFVGLALPNNSLWEHNRDLFLDTVDKVADTGAEK